MLLCNNALFVCHLPCSSVECLLHQGPSTSTGGAHTVWSPGPHLFPSLGVDLRTSQRLVMFRIKWFCSQVHCVSLSSKVHLLINLAVETWLSWRTTHKLFSALEFYNSPPANIIILEGLSYSSSLQTTRCDMAMSIKLFDSIFNWRYLKSKIDKCTHLACNLAACKCSCKFFTRMFFRVFCKSAILHSSYTRALLFLWPTLHFLRYGGTTPDRWSY